MPGVNLWGGGRQILALLEELRALEPPKVNPGVDPRSQGVIPERFKQKNWGRTDA